jgi:phospholipid/cholesterol/gamma-HCH transport system ATP-binding protein
VEGTSLVELRGVSVVRQGYTVLRDVNISLSSGETLFVMGVAGSGKSMFIKVAAGITIPEEGDILYKGKSLDRLAPREEAAFRKSSGFVFQDAALWSNMSLFENLALPVRVHEPRRGRAEVDRAVRRAAELVGYGQDLGVRPAELSSGERKLIGLARALVLDPEILFMDDPTADLDETSAARVPAILDELKSRGRSMIIASAVSELAQRCADSIAVLVEGVIAARGPYGDAMTWSDARVREVTGRLKARDAPEPGWLKGLAGAWVSAMADGVEMPDSRGEPRDDLAGGGLAGGEGGKD